MGREIRKVFIPKEDTDVLLSCDYSQIELRVLAHMSDDKNMIDAFNHHSDIHTKTASEVFKVPVEEVTSLMRSRAKAQQFNTIMGGIGSMASAVGSYAYGSELYDKGILQDKLGSITVPRKPTF
jgi:DNA polymerase I-like protein with 3'-5' exonuclease and polymerase domains